MRQQLDHEEVSIHIEATPEALYDIVADVTRTPELSPEIVSCTWLDGATRPVVGAQFDAVNKAGRGPAWKNRPVVLAADRGREFAFSRTEKFSGTLVWRYLFTPERSGTLVTQPVSGLGWFIIGTLYGHRDRRAGLRAGMSQTLQRLQQVAERNASV